MRSAASPRLSPPTSPRATAGRSAGRRRWRAVVQRCPTLLRASALAPPGAGVGDNTDVPWQAVEAEVRTERRRLLAIVRAHRRLWRARMDNSHGGLFEGAARAVQALDAVLREMRRVRRG